MSKIIKDDVRFLRDSNLKALNKANPFSHALLWMILLFFVAFFIWSYFASLVEVTSGEGKVIPSQQVQVIQNLEGGILEKLFVNESDIVNKDQVLMQIDNTRFKSEYQESKTKSDALKIRIARLEAFLADKPFSLPKDIAPTLQSDFKHQMDLYDSQIDEMKGLKQAAGLIAKELAISKPLIKHGALSQVDILHLESQLNDAQNKILDERNKSLNELNDAKAELAGLNMQNMASEDRLSRTTVRSPVRGIIKVIKINTIGGVIQPGMDVVEIVPLDDTLLIEAKIKPAKIGFLHLDQKAMVKITAYDYSKYGSLPGKIEHISADTITDEKGDSYYTVRVRTNKNYIEEKDSHKKLYIIPGMQASVDLITGNKTVLEYLLKPINQAKQTAMTEK